VVAALTTKARLLQVVLVVLVVVVMDSVMLLGAMPLPLTVVAVAEVVVATIQPKRVGLGHLAS